MGTIIASFLSVGKLILCLWTICLAWTLNTTELEGMIEGIMERISSYNRQSSRIIAGTVWFLLLTPAFCVRFACHQVYRILISSKTPAFAHVGAETDTVGSDVSSASRTESERDSISGEG